MSLKLRSLRELYVSAHEPEKARKVVDLYWAFILSFATLAMLGSVGYGMWLLFMPPQREVSEAVVGSRATGFDKVELQKAVQELQKRQEEFESLMSR